MNREKIRKLIVTGHELSKDEIRSTQSRRPAGARRKPVAWILTGIGAAGLLATAVLLLPRGLPDSRSVAPPEPPQLAGRAEENALAPGRRDGPAHEDASTPQPTNRPPEPAASEPAPQSTEPPAAEPREKPAPDDVENGEDTGPPVVAARPEQAEESDAASVEESTGSADEAPARAKRSSRRSSGLRSHRRTRRPATWWLGAGRSGRSWRRRRHQRRTKRRGAASRSWCSCRVESFASAPQTGIARRFPTRGPRLR